MSMINKKERQKMKRFIKRNPIVYICEDCGREYKDRIPFPEGCKCGNICEDFFREREPSDIKAESDDELLIDVKYDKDVLKDKKERKDFKNKIAKTSAKDDIKDDINDIKKEDIVLKETPKPKPEPKQIIFSKGEKFKVASILHKSGKYTKYTWQELLKMKNEKLKEMYEEFLNSKEKA